MALCEINVDTRHGLNLNSTIMPLSVSNEILYTFNTSTNSHSSEFVLYCKPLSANRKGARLVFSYKLRYIVGFGSISTNPKPTKYRKLYENSRPDTSFNNKVTINFSHNCRKNPLLNRQWINPKPTIYRNLYDNTRPVFNNKVTINFSHNCR